MKDRAGRITLQWFLPVFFLMGAFLWNQANKDTPLGYLLKTENSIKGKLQGTVTSVKMGEDGVEQITINRIHIQRQDGKVITGKGLIIYLDKTDIMVKIGNRIQTEGEITPFSEATNPGQFDMHSYQNIFGIEGMIWGSTIEIIDERSDKIKCFVWEIREILKRKIKELAAPEDYGVFQAVFLGDKSELDETIKDLYVNSGIAHIYAVSGTHISVLGAFFYQLIRKMTGSYGISAMVGSAVLLFYAMLVGNPVSAVRAVVMFICYMIANIKGRIYDLTSALALASIIILIWQPLQITQGSFQLSFAAVLGIGMVGPAILPRWKKHGKFAKTISMALGVQVMITPIQLYHFFTYATYSFFLNFCILPAVPFLILSILAGSMIGFPMPNIGKFIFGTGHYILIYNQLMCQLFLKLPMSLSVLGRPRIIQLAFYYLFVLCFIIIQECIWYRKKGILEWKQNTVNGGGIKEDIKICLMGMICFAIGVAGLKRISMERWTGQMSVTMLDVGQGEGFVIRLPDGSVILIDGGSSSEKSVGEYCIEPYLKFEGIDKIVYAFLSHSDADHINGVLEILERETIFIETCVIPDEKNVEKDFSELISLTDTVGTRIRYLSSGTKLQKGDVKLTCLHPEAGMEAEDLNDTSEVLLLEMKNFRMLFTGDVGSKEEGFSGELSNVPITILKVAHHGSKNSTGEDFLKNIHPQYAWISCSEGNRYGHPHEETLDRLEQLNCDIYMTMEKGAVKLKTDGENMRIFTYKS